MACRVDKRKIFDNKNKSKFEHKNRRQNTQFFCEHYNMHGHTISKCWKVHGYPPNFKNNTGKEENNSSKANAITNDTSTQGDMLVDPKLIQEQYNMLISLLSK